MRRFPTPLLVPVAAAVGAAAAALLYKHAWQLPYYQNLRDSRLYLALWISATPLAFLFAPLCRVARWKTALKAAGVWLCIGAPAYGIGSTFQAVRTSSQDKAILCNLRQLAAAADQYFLENNATIVRYDDLVGADKYVKGVKPIAGEDYGENFPYKQGAILSAEFPSGRIISYAGDATPPDYKNIFEPGDRRPSWRPKRPAVFAPRASMSVDLSDEQVTRSLGQPNHRAHPGTMCASCHAGKR